MGNRLTKMAQRSAVSTLGTLLLLSVATATSASAQQGTDWNGFHVGGHGGFNWGELSGVHDTGGGTGGDSLSVLDVDGGLGGVQIGFDHQRGRYVIGIEGDYTWSSGNDATVTDPPPASPNFLRSELDDLASIRARLGTVIGPVLLFGTVGVGFANYEFSVSEPSALAGPTFGKASIDESGVVFGGGVEIIKWDRVSFRVEYLHYDVGTGPVALAEPPIPDADDDDFVRFDDIDVVRVAISYRFGHGSRTSEPPLK